MERIPLLAPEQMQPEQRRVYERIIAGPRKKLIGPLRAVLHSPELAELWQQFGSFIRYQTDIAPRLKELAILTTARRWSSQIEWYVHATAAAEAGLCATIIDAIRIGEQPRFRDEQEADIYDFTRLLQQTGMVPDTLYKRLNTRLGNRGIVELTSIIGYYTMVSMTLNAHQIPLPAGVAEPLLTIAIQRNTLTELPSATVEPETAVTEE